MAFLAAKTLYFSDGQAIHPSADSASRTSSSLNGFDDGFDLFMLTPVIIQLNPWFSKFSRRNPARNGRRFDVL